MLLDDLVEVIETLKERIAAHGAGLRENQIRTRMALINPLLTALGWDTANLSIVIPEYEIRGQKADYALLSHSGRTTVMLEANRLDQPLAPRRIQMVSHANTSGVPYAALTNGNDWELYEVFSKAPIEQRRILNVSIVSTPAHEAALDLLLLWRPNIASGNPIAAKAGLLDFND